MYLIRSKAMTLVVCDPRDAAEMIARRQTLGLDRFDEVWEGVYVMSPIADNDHQDVVGGFDSILHIVIGWPHLCKVRPGVNVSDRDKGWMDNFRVPHVAVYLLDNPARDCLTDMLGGPDFGIEVASEGDRSRHKLEFYAKIGTRELLVVDRHPWALELYALKRKRFRLVAQSTPADSKLLQSKVVPLTFRLVDGTPRPVIEVRHGSDQVWRV
jgi:hypothetical protein